MKRDELLKLCRYYKGEPKSPFEPGTSKDRFWILENRYVSSYNVFSYDVDFVLKQWPILSSFFYQFDEETQRMLSCFAVLSYSHNPMGGVDFLFDYGK